MPLARFFSTFALLVALGTAHASGSVSPDAARDRKPLLWRLSNGGATVYVLGSFHLLREQDYPLPREVDEAFWDAESVVFEVAPSELERPDNPATVRRLARAADGVRLSERLDPARASALEAALAKRGLRLGQYEEFAPWLVNGQLVAGISHGAGYRHEFGVDKHLMRRAREAGKPVSGLETFEDQMRTSAAAPVSEQLATLKALLAAPDAVASAFDALRSAWTAGDVETLDRLTRQGMKQSSPVSYRLVNTDRNNGWLPKLVELLQRPAGSDTLVVVGSMHLLGDDGVLALLASRGYVAQQLGGNRKGSLYALQGGAAPGPGAAAAP
ncbi:TraB/GumN family protein [Cognatilysobacter bugurensis]|uniref:TraB/GumN family protein n=1 Tax=Cognatilysobacter bugurensis TaxID=543356 RepID=A0A918SY25_9GAMM|nr:TraB/GumN family protein [Lysobacter bugurensis]GHA72814.1 TraB/GumN family protein [Lysobacter bugurensis]